jgi:hypothetical protein
MNALIFGGLLKTNYHRFCVGCWPAFLRLGSGRTIELWMLFRVFALRGRKHLLGMVRRVMYRLMLLLTLMLRNSLEQMVLRHVMRAALMFHSHRWLSIFMVDLGHSS